jgi:hypothetical protein
MIRLIARRSGWVLAFILAAVALPASAVTLAGFSAGTHYSVIGTVDSPTQPDPLMVLLDVPALQDTFIRLASANTDILTITGGGVTVLEGQTAATVLLSAFGPGGYVSLKASFGEAAVMTTIAVVEGIPAVPAPPAAWMLVAGLLAVLTVAKRRAAV